jgi:mannose-1-phosphate guanylyltransferase
MTVKGIIMAGGEGKRFRPLSYYLQKCMIPVGFKEKPILEYIIRLLKHHNITDLKILTGYKSKQIENYFNAGSRFGVELKYILDNPDKKGSANSLLNAYEENAFSKSDTLVVYYGDILSNIDLSEALKQHLETKSLATIALAKGFGVNVGTADMKGLWIKKFVEKPILETPVSIGVLILNGQIITEMEKIYTKDKETFDLMGDVIQNLVEKNMKVSGYVTDAFWYDVGSIERFERISNDQINEALDFLF